MAKNFKRFAIGALIAGAAGFIAGILTAPKSGKELRGDIKTKTGNTVTEAERQLKQLHTELSDRLTEVQHKGSAAKGKAKAEVDDISNMAASAKQKAREILSAIHEGDADNKELKKAIADSQKALKHLKAFLKK